MRSCRRLLPLLAVIAVALSLPADLAADRISECAAQGLACTNACERYTTVDAIVRCGEQCSRQAQACAGGGAGAVSGAGKANQSLGTTLLEAGGQALIGLLNRKNQPDARTAAEIDRSNAAKANNKGVDAWQKGDYQEALRRFYEAHTLDPSNEKINKNLELIRKKLDMVSQENLARYRAEAQAAQERIAREKAAVGQDLQALAGGLDSGAATAPAGDLAFVGGRSGSQGTALPAASESRFSRPAAGEPVETRKDSELSATGLLEFQRLNEEYQEATGGAKSVFPKNPEAPLPNPLDKGPKALGRPDWDRKLNPSGDPDVQSGIVSNVDDHYNPDGTVKKKPKPDPDPQ